MYLSYELVSLAKISAELANLPRWKIREHGLGGGLQDYYRQLSSLVCSKSGSRKFKLTNGQETNMLDFTWADWLWA